METIPQNNNNYWFTFSSTGYSIFDQNNKLVEKTSKHRKFPQFPFNKDNCRYKNRDKAKERIKELTKE